MTIIEGIVSAIATLLYRNISDIKKTQTFRNETCNGVIIETMCGKKLQVIVKEIK